MGSNNMGDFDYVGKRTRTLRRAYRNSERVERLKGSNRDSNGVKKLRYLTTSSDFVDSPEKIQRFYGILSPQQKEVFGFLYVNPLERILEESKYLSARTRGLLDKKTRDILSFRGLSGELSRYAEYLVGCISINNRDLLTMTLNLKSENPRFVNYFLSRAEELVTKALHNRKRLNNTLDDLASEI